MKKSEFAVGVVSGVAFATIAITGVAIMGGIGSESVVRTRTAAPSVNRYDVVPMLGGVGLGVIDHEHGTFSMYTSWGVDEYKKVTVYSFDDMGDVWKPNWEVEEVSP